jgi:HEAT repeat protein
MSGRKLRIILGLLLAISCGLSLTASGQQGEPADQDLVIAYRRLRFERQYPPEMAAYIQSKIQDAPRASKALAELAKDERPDVRALVSMLLGELGQPEGASTLWHLLRDDVEYVRLTAAGAIIRLTQSTPVPIAVDGLSDPRPAVRRLTAITLAQLKDKAAESTLIDTLRDEDEKVRMDVARALGLCGTETAVPSLIEMLHDRSVLVRQETANALSNFADPSVAPALAEALKDPDWHVRAAATTALAKVTKVTEQQTASSTPLIISKLQEDEYALVRDRAADALGLPNDKKAVAALVTAIISNDRDARFHAAKTIERSRATSALSDLMEHRLDPNPEVRLKIIEIFGEIGGSDQVPAIAEALNDSDANVRLAAVTALRRMQEAGVAEALKQKLGDTDPHVRAQAARTLGDLGDRSAVSNLIAELRDENGYVRGAAAEALGKLGDKSAVPSLVNVLAGVRPQKGIGPKPEGLIIGTGANLLPEMAKLKQVEEKVKAVQALGEIGDSEAADPIIQYGLKSEDAGLRAESAYALGKMRVERAVEPLKSVVAPYYETAPLDTENVIASETSVPDSVRLMKEKEARVRASVAWALGQIADPTSVQTLNRAANDVNSLVRDAAIEALAKINEHQEALAPAGKTNRPVR